MSVISCNWVGGIGSGLKLVSFRGNGTDKVDDKKSEFL